MGTKNYFFSGITELLILAILIDHDSYGYEFVKFIKEFSNGLLAISQNTIYAVTYKLENEGKISQYSKLVGKRRTRIYYHIEPEGEEYYTQLLTSFRDAYTGVENILSTLDKNKKGENNE
jgi:PadR family transcriptional regulator PadR